MNNPWIILDCNYLCHLAKHTTGGLSHDNKPTGVLYGFLRSLEMFQDRLHSSRFVFCWDSKYSKRREIFPAYKAKRLTSHTPPDEIAEEEQQMWEMEYEFRQQMKRLRLEYLPAIGFKNVLCQRGYESDDLMASIVLGLGRTEEAVIVTSDADLYQMIRQHVSFYNPQKNQHVTFSSFQKEYEIKPWDYGVAKAVAGCPTDEVPGAKGVGIKTAMKWIKGDLAFGTKAYQTIDEFTKTPEYQRNIKLVILPLGGTKQFTLKEDYLSEQGWNQVTEKLGMKSIRNRLPIRYKKRRRKE